MLNVRLFNTFEKNLKDSTEYIEYGCAALTGALNSYFRGTEDKESHGILTGSAGRGTAINCTDLVMLYIIPESFRPAYEGEFGATMLLLDVQNQVHPFFETCTISDEVCVKGTGKDINVEIHPVFVDDEGALEYPGRKPARTWKDTDPRIEASEFDSTDKRLKGRFRPVCKMTRAWRDTHKVDLSDLAIDTYAYDFFHAEGAEGIERTYPELMRSFLEYLSEIPVEEPEEKDEEKEAAEAAAAEEKKASGKSSRKRSSTHPFKKRVKKVEEPEPVPAAPSVDFREEAKAAALRCSEAIEAPDAASTLWAWKDVFGPLFTRTMS